MLTAIDPMDDDDRRMWHQCTTRDFNVGYDCSATPTTLTDTIPLALLADMARTGSSLTITLYAPS
jgi:hypothetical protein